MKISTMKKTALVALALVAYTGSSYGQSARSWKWKQAWKMEKRAAAKAGSARAIEDDEPRRIYTIDKIGGANDSAYVETFYYNAEGKVTRMDMKYLNPGVEYLHVRKTYTYYNDGEKEVVLHERSKDGVKYEMQSKDSTVYQEEDLLLYEAEYRYDEVKKSWELQSASENTYTMQDGIFIGQESKSYDPISKQWVNEQKIEAELNADKSYKQVNVFIWNPDTKAYEQMVRLVNVELDGQNFDNPKKYTIEFQVFGSWIAVQRYAANYNSDGDIISSLSEENDFAGGGGWQNSSKEEYQYDAFRNLTEYKNYSWDGSWQVDRGNKFIFTYDNEGRVATGLEQDYNMASSQFEDKELKTYMYELSAGVNDYAGGLVTRANIYPNPVAIGAKVTMTNLPKDARIATIVGMDGRQYTANVQQGTVDVSALPRGVYSVAVVDTRTGSSAVSRVVVR